MSPLIFSFLVLVQQFNDGDLISPDQQDQLAYWTARSTGLPPGESPQAKRAALDREREELLACLLRLKAVASAPPPNSSAPSTGNQ